MGRGRTKTKPISITNGLSSEFKKYVTYNMNPVELNKDYYGGYIPSNLAEIKRRYEVLCSSIKVMIGQRKDLLQKIGKTEESPRSRYNILMRKADKNKEEHEELYFRIMEIEDMYNDLTPLDRRIRDDIRLLKAVYPTQLMEIVYSELGEEMKGEEF